MKLSRIPVILSIGLVLILISITFLSSSSFGQEPFTSTTQKYLNQNHQKFYQEINTPVPLKSFKKNNKNEIQDIQINIIDSLFNGFSYFSSDQQPFIYDVDRNTLVTIKRGALDDVSASAGNTLNNLFFRTSPDWGETWTDPVLLYNSKTDPIKQNARYPSIYPFIYENELVYTYTAPLVSTNPDLGWQGYLNGLYSGVPLNTGSLNKDLIVNNLSYGWAGTDSYILGGLIGQDPYAIAIGSLMPPGGSRDGSWADNSNLAYRRTIDFSSWQAVIPPSWASSAFLLATADSSRSGVIRGLQFVPVTGTNRKMYCAAFGNFVNGQESRKAEPAFSISQDDGATWGDFDVFDVTLALDYAASQGADPDSTFFGFSWSSSGFTVLDNGDVSFVMQLKEYNANKTTLEEFRQLVEVYNQGGTWGIRKIADIGPYWLPLYDNDNTKTMSLTMNQMDHEVQVSRTVDGKMLLAKWTDLVDVSIDEAAGTFTFKDVDVYIATRKASDSKWTSADVTNDSLIYHRQTWIPNLLPNDLKNIPMIELFSILDPNEDDNARYIRYRNMYVPQYVACSFFDGNLVVGVEDNTPTAPATINDIYPNPTDGMANIRFSVPVDGNTSIEIYNLVGEKVMTVQNGFLSQGLHSVSMKTENLPSGTYYCSLSSNGNKITKILNVIH